jgi:LacI family transcriptional regulator
MEMIKLNVTIKDIAKELGISYSSVSRAINNKPSVSKETRKKVLEAAERMGYRPNYLARGLVNKISNTIGVIIPDIVNPFFAEITKGVMETADKYGYTVFLCVTNWDEKKEKDYIQTLQEKRVDGIILKSSKDKKIDTYKNIQVPYILLESVPSNGRCSFIEVDNERGGYIATKHLIDCGYKNLAFLGGKRESYSNGLRKAGFIRAAEEYKERIENTYVFFGDFSMTGGYQLASELFENGKKVDGIFAGNDVIALGVLQYAKEFGIEIPRDLGVVGFDNIFYTNLPQIQMTTIHQPKYALGKIVLETLVEEIRSKETRIIRRITLEPELIIRKTTRTLTKSIDDDKIKDE